MPTKRRRWGPISGLVLTVLAATAAQDPTAPPPPDPEPVLRVVGAETVALIRDSLKNPSLRALWALALSENALGDREAACERLRHAADLVLSPDRPERRLNGGRLYSDPTDEFLLLVHFQELCKDTEGARDTLRKVLANFDQPDQRLPLFQFPELLGALKMHGLEAEIPGLVRKAEVFYSASPDSLKKHYESQMVALLAASGASERAWEWVDALEASPEDDKARHDRVAECLSSLLRSVTRSPAVRAGEPPKPTEGSKLRALLDETERRVERIPLARNRMSILHDLARQRAAIGDFEGADRALVLVGAGEGLAERQGDASDVLALIGIARDQHRLGQSDAARARLQAVRAKLQATAESFDSFTFLAEGMVDAGNAKGAVQCLEEYLAAVKLPPRDQTCLALALAKARRAAGDEPGVRQAGQLAVSAARERLAHPAPPPAGPNAPVRQDPAQAERSERFVATMDLALALVAAGEYEAARATVDQVTPPERRASMAGSVAYELARYGGQARSTLAWVRTIEVPPDLSTGSPLQRCLDGICNRLYDLKKTSPK